MWKKMKKEKLRYLFGFLSQLCAMAMAGLLVFATVSCMFVGSMGNINMQDVFSEKESFDETDPFYQLFHRDVMNLSDYLAFCSQIVTDGKFDETKRINILDYVNRRGRVAPEQLDGVKLEYMVGDLIEWYNMGFGYEEIEVTQEEAAHSYEAASDSEGIFDETTEAAASDSVTEDIATDTAGETTYIVTEDTTEEIPNEQVLESGENTQKLVHVEKLIEYSKPVNLDSLYDLQLPEDCSAGYEEIAGYVQEAAADLSANYYNYTELKDYMTRNSNLKYMLVTKTGTIVYTNLDTKNQETKALIKEFNKCKTEIVYNYGTNTITCNNTGDYLETGYRSIFHNYAYCFPEGGTLYVGVQTEESDAFGTYNLADVYASGAFDFKMMSQNMDEYLILSAVLGILALFFLLLFIVFQPKKKREELQYFDKWFTEIAAAFAGGSAILISVGAIYMLDGFFSSDIAGVVLKKCVGITSFTAFAILWMLLLAYMGSLVRRIKARSLWKDSLCYYFLHHFKSFCLKTWHFFGRAFGVLLNHRSLIVRTFVPYLIFLLVNLFLILLSDRGIGGILVAFVMDMFVAAYLYLNNMARERIVKGISRICDGEVDYQIYTEHLFGENKVLAEAVNQIGNAVKNAVQISMKDERLKADLITNVSHDIKTPLTSIINYVDLLKRENIPNEKAQEYIRVLDEKSQRLKQLTLDLVEASKISSGNITLELEDLDVAELMKQAIGEYEDKFEEKQLIVVTDFPQEEGRLMIHADSRRMWRIVENLMVNIYKYAMPGTRVYMDLLEENQQVMLTVKNISAQPLNIPAEQLTERFIRGDISRSTEGSGLGLSIAKNLTLAQNGSFDIYLDGDLFKVSLCFPRCENK